MQIISWLILAIIIIIALIGITIAITNKEKRDIYMAVTIGIIVLLFAVGVFFFITTKEDNIVKKAIDDDSGIVSFVPIWIAVFIPLLVARRKKKEPLTPEKKRVMFILLGLVFAAVLGTFLMIFVSEKNMEKTSQITSFQECIDAGYPVMESYPRQCRADNTTFVENIGNELEKTDLIRVDCPRPNQIVQSPLIVRGEARGTWFFEAVFPIILTDWDGRIIGEGYATAKENWMTEDFVPFEGILNFTKPSYKNNGALILRKDNPSGLPEYDDALEIPVLFK